MVVSVWVVSPHDHVGDLGDSTAQYHQRVLYHILLAWEKKIKIQSTITVECKSLSHHHKVEKLQVEPLLVRDHLYELYSYNHDLYIM